MDLHNLEFVQENDEFSISKIALPDELPKLADRNSIPQDILKSTTIENLFSQNEDLMGRLKVTLRRLSGIELENERLAESARKANMSQTLVHDQLLILKEKDGLWKSRSEILNTEKRVLQEKYDAIEKKAAGLSASVERHQKYHEKIRLQVKPYIAQLKEYSKNLQEQIQASEIKDQKQEALIADIRSQIIEITKSSRAQLEIETKKNQQLTAFYEKTLDENQRELEILRDISKDHDFKTLKLNKSLERQDWLENEVIQISRSKEELKVKLEEEVNSLQARIHELNRQNQRLGMEHADLQVRVFDDSQQIQNLKTENEQIREQLESLRYMWTAKNEETNKLKSALQSLERINLDLSQKINDLRENQSTSL